VIIQYILTQLLLEIHNHLVELYGYGITKWKHRKMVHISLISIF